MAAVPALGLLAGCAVGLLAPDISSPRCFAALAISVAGATGAWRWGHQRALLAAVSLAFAAGGCLLASDAWQDAWRPSLRPAFDELATAQHADAGRATHSEDPEAVATIVGRLRRDAMPTSAGVSLSVDVQEIWMPCPRPVEGGVLLTVVGGIANGRVNDWRAGRRIRAAAQLRRPSRYLNPGAVDQERALARRGTILVGTVKSGALVDVLERGSALAEGASAFRAFVRRAIISSVGRWSTRAGAIVTAIVIGDRAGLDDRIESRLQEAGTYHVIAISGGNIAILTGLALGIFRFAGLLGRTAMLSAIAGLMSYAYLVGGGASVNRATLMAIVYLAGRALDLRGAPANSLAVAAGLLVAADPLAIADPGFLLTFGATIGILSVSSWRPVQRLPPRWRVPAAMLAASAAAEAMLAPVGAALFFRVTFAGLVLNFAAIPAMAVAQVAGMLAVATALVSEGAAPAVGWVAFAGAETLVRSADLVALAPFVSWRVGPPHWVAIAAYYISLVTLAAIRPDLSASVRQRSRRATALAAAGVFALVAAWIVTDPWPRLTAADGHLRITFIDVGQGDATFVRFPHGSTVLVDAGGLGGSSSFDIGDRVVAPVLRRAGVRTLDTLVITHGDADHMGGAPSVVREFKPHDVWEGIPVPPFEPLRALALVASQHRAQWVNLQAADRVTVDGVQLLVHHPGIADWERQRVRNDDSVVLELRWGDVSIVLTGDIGREVEQTIAGRFEPAALRVVKVAHHGSLTSSSAEFIQALAPTIAVVSAGRSNPFGHPSPVVLRRYQDAGAEIFRTDRDGAVILDTDGRQLRVETFTKRVAVLAAKAGNHKQ